MPHAPSDPDRPVVPHGVPRWLWPPPGAEVVSRRLAEHFDGATPATYACPDGAIDLLHLRALYWLLDEHPRAPQVPGVPSDIEVRIEVARTALPRGRVGHAYALDAGPLGAPSGDVARGVVWRYLHAVESGRLPSP